MGQAGMCVAGWSPAGLGLVHQGMQMMRDLFGDMGGRMGMSGGKSVMGSAPSYRRNAFAPENVTTPSGDRSADVRDSPAREPADDLELTIGARRGGYTPSVVRVRKGDTVRLTLRAEDTQHGLGLFAYNLNAVAAPHAPATLEFTATEEGEYLFACTVPCGPGHSNTRGVLVVEPTDAA